MNDPKYKIVFSTFGPFRLAHDAGEAALDNFWDDVEKQTDKVLKQGDSLRHGTGVYVFVKRQGKSFMPWYVGKTDAGFEKRFKQHGSSKGNLPKFFQDFGKDGIEVFLIARLNSSGKLSKQVSKKRQSIDRLEFALIGTCLTVNPDLKNKSQKSFHGGLVVPGYLNDGEQERGESAKKFARMVSAK